MALEEVVARCIEKWQREDIPLCPPIAEAEIRRVWGELGREVSEDVLRLYAQVGGFADDHYDEEFFWALWPFPRLLCENENFPTEGVLFCDHSIHIATWELRYEDERRSSVWQVDYRTPGWSQMTAGSLEEFIRMYLDDPWQLL